MSSESHKPIATATYTAGHVPSSYNFHAVRSVTDSAPHLIPFIKPGLSILDVGCGPGSITLEFAEAVGPEGHVVAVDFNETVLGIAKEKAKERGLQNITFLRGDINELPFASGGLGTAGAEGGFDIVHAHQVLQHISTPLEALKEMKRVAKPNGGIVSCRESDFGSFFWHPDPLGKIEEWSQMYQKIQTANGGDPICGRKLKSYALQAGFEPSSITVSSSNWVYESEERRKFWIEIMVGRLKVGQPMYKKAMELGLKTEEEMETIRRGWTEWADAKTTDGFFQLSNVEIICKK